MILLCQPSCWGYGHGYGYVQPYLLSFALVNIHLDSLKFFIIADSLNNDSALTFFICFYFGYIILLPYAETKKGATEHNFRPGHTGITYYCDSKHKELVFWNIADYVP